MLQVIEGKSVYVVNFDTMPELPIRGLTDGEYLYERVMSHARGFKYPWLDDLFARNGRYARALTEAIETGIITEPGKYGIYIVPGTVDYEIHKIIEP